MKLQLKAVVSRGWYKLLDSHLACQFLSQFEPNTEILVTYQESKPKVWKSYSQLKLAHALIKVIDRDTGNLCMERTKRQVKEQIGYFKMVENPITKVMEKDGLSFADASKEEMTEIIEQIISLCEFLGINIPPTHDEVSLYNFIDNQFK